MMEVSNNLNVTFARYKPKYVTMRAFFRDAFTIMTPKISKPKIIKKNINPNFLLNKLPPLTRFKMVRKIGSKTTIV